MSSFRTSSAAILLAALPAALAQNSAAISTSVVSMLSATPLPITSSSASMSSPVVTPGAACTGWTGICAPAQPSIYSCISNTVVAANCDEGPPYHGVCLGPSPHAVCVPGIATTTTSSSSITSASTAATLTPGGSCTGTTAICGPVQPYIYTCNNSTVVPYPCEGGGAIGGRCISTDEDGPTAICIPGPFHASTSTTSSTSTTTSTSTSTSTITTTSTSSAVLTPGASCTGTTAVCGPVQPYIYSCISNTIVAAVCEQGAPYGGQCTTAYDNGPIAICIPGNYYATSSTSVSHTSSSVTPAKTSTVSIATYTGAAAPGAQAIAGTTGWLFYLIGSIFAMSTGAAMLVL